ncbi:MAG: hypothetical protein JJLCMIEE_01141 [Acidimicrobiales bacterium]|nr:MAG: PASTA domain-containing protein [Actinomycetota bacterium]MBV6508081.1 hypothetical protein [Acidimicrobiales bacterium]RIK05294.1 MAG: hypothetical protein DCC48_10460 [Acidobacteriota bacterium]
MTTLTPDPAAEAGPDAEPAVEPAVEPEVEPEARLYERGRPEVVDPRGRRLAFSWSLTLLLVLLGGAVFGLVRTFGSDEDVFVIPEVVVPDLRGYEVVRAESTLEDLGLLVEYSYEENEEVPENVVFGHEPRSGAIAELDSVVTLRVSLGPATAPVPDVVGQQVSEARRVLEAAGYIVEEAHDFDDEVRVGEVITTNPEPFADVGPGAVVTITVSDGPAAREVPNLVGTPYYQALVEVGRIGLLPGTIERRYVEGVEENLVLEVEPAAGTKLPKDASVNLVVSAPRPTVEVPHLVGLLCSSAESVLGEIGLGHDVAYELVDDTTKAGRVIRQSPPAELEVPTSAFVSVTCGSAPAPPPAEAQAPPDTSGAGGDTG